jgi:hypothetical protein
MFPFRVRPTAGLSGVSFDGFETSSAGSREAVAQWNLAEAALCSNGQKICAAKRGHRCASPTSFDRISDACQLTFQTISQRLCGTGSITRIRMNCAGWRCGNQGRDSSSRNHPCSGKTHEALLNEHRTVQSVAAARVWRGLSGQA